LRNFGLKVGPVRPIKFEARIRELINDHPDLAVVIEPVLIVRRTLRQQVALLHRHGELRPDPANPRLHNKKQVRQIATSIRMVRSSGLSITAGWAAPDPAPLSWARWMSGQAAGHFGITVIVWLNAALLAAAAFAALSCAPSTTCSASRGGGRQATAKPRFSLSFLY
jgi:hypothetical protein